MAAYSDIFSEYCSMEFQTIKIQLGESMAWVNLDRPEVRNALNAEMIQELTEALDWLDSRNDIRVIILKGNGSAFCAGADLHYMKSTAKYGFAQNISDAEKLSKLFRTLYYNRKATIAVVHGACIGGANGLVAAADIVIAEKETKFAFPEVRLGLTPATISPFVFARMGNAACRELMLTGRRFTADEAKDYGLVNVVVEEAELVDTERRYIEQFMHASPDAIDECKHLIRMISGTDNNTDIVFYNTSVAIANQRVSKDGQEGMSAFFEKRKPSWDL